MKRTIGIVAASLMLLASCSSDSSDDATPEETESTSSSTTVVERPDGPAADISEELPGEGEGAFVTESVSGIEVPSDWTQREFVAAGTAQAEGHPDADYRTRIAVRYPSAEDFNGTVVVEWLNVSSGLDSNPDFLMTAEEIFREGYAWVGVSAQRIGVEGGDVAVPVDAAGDLAGKGLKVIDPERYGSLEHPGDAYAYDMYTQIGRGLRANEGALGDLEPERVLANGESQSAFALTTYANEIQPETKAFDGFLIHSRGASGLGFGEPGGSLDIAGSISGDPEPIRTDLEVPTIIVESETDLFSIINYLPARQDDTDTIRVWEIAGTAHADTKVLGAAAELIDCGVPVNDGPQHFVVKAALHSLDAWVRTGEAPAMGAPLSEQRDADGIILDGIRTPQVDVPAQVLSGEPGPNADVICLLLGSTEPLAEERLAELYESPEDYLAQYEAATDAAIEAGFVLEADRQAVLDDAKPDLIS